MKFIHNFTTLAVLTVALAFASVASAQMPTNGPDLTIDAAARSAVIDSLIKQLNDAYVFPETAKRWKPTFVRDKKAVSTKV